MTHYERLVQEAEEQVGSMGSRVEELIEHTLGKLRSGHGPELLDAALRELADGVKSLDQLDREFTRRRAAQFLDGLGIKGAAALVKAAFGTNGGRPPSGSGAGRRMVLATPEPWEQAVDGADLLDRIVEIIQRHIVLCPECATAAALWAVHTHAHDAADASPILTVTSPVRESGKTRLVTILTGLVPRPLPTSNITPAALFRSIEKFRPTLFVDEGDTFLKLHDELRGILNAGHTRAAATVVRTAGEDHEPRMFSTWCPKCVALIGSLPDTLMSRSIVVPLHRRLPHEQITGLREDLLRSELEPLARQAARWAADHEAELEAADPTVPAELSDRGGDCWRPLLAIADLVGGQWPQRARDAAKRLSVHAADAQDEPPEIQLLADLRTLFQGRQSMRSEEIVAALEQLEDRPWPEWRGGKALTKTGLARLLRPFEIRPEKWREGKETVRGYWAKQFVDAWARYLPELATPATLATGNPMQDLRVADVAPVSAEEQYLADEREGMRES